MKRAVGFFLLAAIIASSSLLVKLLTKNYVIHCTKHSSYKPCDLKDVKVQKPFVIVIPSYNNEEYVEKNLDSVFEQKYSNYRVIYIDDCSIDKTHEKVLACVQRHHAEDKITIIRNPKNQKALYNLYYAIHSARDDEIVLMLDGDDWIASPLILRDLNRYYNDENVWMTFGQFITYPAYARGKCRMPFFGALERGLVRQRSFFLKEPDFLFSHLRTFYAGLFKRIKMKDLLYEGHFYPVAWDLAIMFPMLEMARGHARFIPEIMYVYNRENPLSDDQLRLKQQKLFDRHIRALPSYASLTESPKIPILETEKMEADVFVVSKDRPTQLFSFLESLYQYGVHFDQVYVSYTASDIAFAKGYELVKRHFPKVIFQREGDGCFVDFIAKVFDPSSKGYVVLAEDQLILKDTTNMKSAISLLEQTGAYSFFFHLGLNINELPMNMIPVGRGCFIWSFAHGQDEWARSNNLQMALYRKQDVRHYLNYMTFTNSSEFCGKWQKGLEVLGIGLCYKDSRVLKAPMRITKVETGEKITLYTEKELNDRLLEGLKIDITPIFHFQNAEPTIEFYPLFIHRS